MKDKRWGDHSDGRESGHQRGESVVLAALDKIEELEEHYKKRVAALEKRIEELEGLLK